MEWVLCPWEEESKGIAKEKLARRLTKLPHECVHDSLPTFAGLSNLVGPVVVQIKATGAVGSRCVFLTHTFREILKSTK